MSARQLQGIVAAVVVAVALVLAYAGLGGTSFKPVTVASPCAPQAVPDPGADLDRVGQTLVLMAGRDAACTLGVSREELILALPSPTERAALLRREGKTEAQLGQLLKTGLEGAVDRLDRAGHLPSSSELVDAYKGQLDLGSAALGLLDQVPDATIDQFVPVPEILRDAVRRLDAQRLVDDLDDQDALQRDIAAAIQEATVAKIQSVISQQTDLLKGLFG